MSAYVNKLPDRNASIKQILSISVAIMLLSATTFGIMYSIKAANAQEVGSSNVGIIGGSSLSGTCTSTDATHIVTGDRNFGTEATCLPTEILSGLDPLISVSFVEFPFTADSIAPYDTLVLNIASPVFFNSDPEDPNCDSSILTSNNTLTGILDTFLISGGKLIIYDSECHTSTDHTWLPKDLKFATLSTVHDGLGQGSAEVVENNTLSKSHSGDQFEVVLQGEQGLCETTDACADANLIVAIGSFLCRDIDVTTAVGTLGTAVSGTAHAYSKAGWRDDNGNAAKGLLIYNGLDVDKVRANTTNSADGLGALARLFLLELRQPWNIDGNGGLPSDLGCNAHLTPLLTTLSTPEGNVSPVTNNPEDEVSVRGLDGLEGSFTVNGTLTGPGTLFKTEAATINSTDPHIYPITTTLQTSDLSLNTPGEYCWDVKITENLGHYVPSQATEIGAFDNNECFTILAPAELQIAPASHDFGSVVVGQSSANQTFTITNIGGNSTSALSVSLTGDNSTSFTIVSDNCDTTILGPSNSCTVDVKFNPTGNSSLSANLAVSAASGGTVSASITGQGVTLALAALQLTPSSHDFGSVQEGSESSAFNFTITNTGEAPSSTISIELTGSNASQFTIIFDGCNGVSLASGAECIVEVKFTPATEGSMEASLNASATTGGSESAALTGTGTLLPKVTIIKHIDGGSATLQNFTLMLNNNPVVNGTATNVTAGVQQNVSETFNPPSLSSNYTASFTGDCNSDGIIEASIVQPDTNLQCIMTNTFVPPPPEIHPAINLTKSANSTDILQGVAVTYNYTVINTGDVILRNVTVTDDKLGAIVSASDGITLNPGENVTFTRTTELQANTTNTAVASGNFTGGQVVSDTASVTVTVTTPPPPPVNHAPIARNDSYSTSENATLNVPSASGVLANDTDLDGDLLTAVLGGGVAHGSLTLNANGSFAYSPESDFDGVDTFTYRANDSRLDSDIANVTITVNTVNHAPVAVDDTYSTDEDTPLNVPAPGVLANDTDVDGDGLFAIQVSGPSHGTLSLDANGSFVYTPNANFHGTDTFTYKANDGTDDSNVATVTITVNAAPPPPPPANTQGKITAGGAEISKGVNFGFVVQSSDGKTIKGQLEYQDKSAGINLHSVEMTLLRISSDGKFGTFEGTASINGKSGYAFTITVEDNGEPGSQKAASKHGNTPDRLGIEISGPDLHYKISLSDLIKGNIQIHKQH